MSEVAAERVPVDTRVVITLDYGEPELEADDAGIAVGGTAAEVIEAMKADVRRTGSRRDVVREWDLDDDPDIHVEVYTRYSDGTHDSTSADWSIWTDHRDQEATRAAAAEAGQ